MMARALSERWPIKDEYRVIVVRKLLAIIADPESSRREVTAAIKALISADRNNIEQEKLSQIDEHHSERMQSEQLDRIAAVAQQLGLTRVVDAIATERPGSDFVANVSAGGATAGNSGTR